jgi:hypothetical protein
LDAIELLTGAVPFLIAAGGVCGAEGSYWIGVDGDEDEVQAAVDLVKSIADEPACEP